MANLSYLSGLNNEHQTEAVPGVLPVGQNSPQQVAGGYITEQISGTAFTVDLDNGYLGSRIDEERSEMRYLV